MQHSSGPQHFRGYDTCLIVEDSQFDQELIARAIKRSHGDMKIEVATTLQSARRALQRNGYSLILLDNNLPDGLGANFAIELAAHKVHSKIPIIMISDWPSPFMWEKAAAAGVLYVVNKTEFGSRYIHAALKASRERAAKLN